MLLQSQGVGRAGLQRTQSCRLGASLQRHRPLARPGRLGVLHHTPLGLWPVTVQLRRQAEGRKRALVCAAARVSRLSSSVSKLERDEGAGAQSQEVLLVGAVTTSQASLQQVEEVLVQQRAACLVMEAADDGDSKQQALHALAQRLGIPVVLAHSPSSIGMLQRLQQQGLAAPQASLAQTARSSAEAARAAANGTNDAAAVTSDGSGRSDIRGSDNASSSSSSSSSMAQPRSASKGLEASAETSGLAARDANAVPRSIQQLVSNAVAQQGSSVVTAGMAAAQAQGQRDLPDLTKRPRGPADNMALERKRAQWRKGLGFAYFLLQLRENGYDWRFIGSDDDDDSDSDDSDDDSADDDDDDVFSGSRGRRSGSSNGDGDDDVSSGSISASRGGSAGEEGGDDADHILMIDSGDATVVIKVKIVDDSSDNGSDANSSSSGDSDASTSGSNSSSGSSGSSGGGDSSGRAGRGGRKGSWGRQEGRSGRSTGGSDIDGTSRVEKSFEEEAKYLAAIQRLEEQFSGTMDADWQKAQQRSSTTGYAKAASSSNGSGSSGSSSMDEDEVVELKRPTKPQQPANDDADASTEGAAAAAARAAELAQSSSQNPVMDSTSSTRSATHAANGTPSAHPADNADSATADITTPTTAPVAAGESLPGASSDEDGGGEAGSGADDDVTDGSDDDQEEEEEGARGDDPSMRLQKMIDASSLRLPHMSMTETAILMSGLAKMTNGGDPSRTELHLITRLLRDAIIVSNDPSSPSTNAPNPAEAARRRDAALQRRERRRAVLAGKRDIAKRPDLSRMRQPSLRPRSGRERRADMLKRVRLLRRQRRAKVAARGVVGVRAVVVQEDGVGDAVAEWMRQQLRQRADGQQGEDSSGSASGVLQQPLQAQQKQQQRQQQQLPVTQPKPSGLIQPSDNASSRQQAAGVEGTTSSSHAPLDAESSQAGQAKTSTSGGGVSASNGSTSASGSSSNGREGRRGSTFDAANCTFYETAMNAGGRGALSSVDEEEDESGLSAGFSTGLGSGFSSSSSQGPSAYVLLQQQRSRAVLEALHRALQQGQQQQQQQQKAGPVVAVVPMGLLSAVEQGWEQGWGTQQDDN